MLARLPGRECEGTKFDVLDIPDVRLEGRGGSIVPLVGEAV